VENALQGKIYEIFYLVDIGRVNLNRVYLFFNVNKSSISLFLCREVVGIVTLGC